MERSRANRLVSIARTLLAAAAACPAVSAAGEVTLTLDNDFFVGFDRHYTNGLQVAVLAETASLPGALRGLHPFDSDVDRQYTFAVGQRIYTPADKSLATPDPRDRPYAGWLYALLEFRKHRDGALDHFMASIGMVGPASLAHQTQDAVHHLLGQDTPQGWNAQLHNEPALLAAYERAWPGAVAVSFDRLRFDFTPRVGITAGAPRPTRAAGTRGRALMRGPSRAISSWTETPFARARASSARISCGTCSWASPPPGAASASDSPS